MTPPGSHTMMEEKQPKLCTRRRGNRKKTRGVNVHNAELEELQTAYNTRRLHVLNSTSHNFDLHNPLSPAKSTQLKEPSQTF